jgi:5,10-methylene-tetrahydrofolate dehydrogenase/methenyl tetrahydrofolate cyclohydrolase
VSKLAKTIIEQNGGICTPVPGGVGKWTVRELVLRLKEMEKENAAE